MEHDSENLIPETFINEVKDSGLLWGLLFEDEWVVCDSQEGSDIDVMPLWSSEQAAKKLCCDEWSEYEPASITLDEFFDEWVNDLQEDGVLIGVQWDSELVGFEVEAMEFAQTLADF